MKKILIILSLILLIGCSKKEEYKSFEGGYEMLNDFVNIDKDWSEKFGKHGIFYTDHEDFIIINELGEYEDLGFKIIDDVNFYLPKHWPLGSDHDIFLEPDEFDFFKFHGLYTHGKGKIFKDGDRRIYVMVCVKEGKIDELYEKTFK